MSGDARPACSSTASCRGWRSTSACSRKRRTPTTPLLERLKFAAIVASNLDEFFMVRVAGLQHAVADGDESPDIAGLTPSQQLAAVAARAHAMVASLYRLDDRTSSCRRWRRQACGSSRGRISGAPSRSRSATFFREQVLPVLTPLAIDMSRPFPLLSSLSLNLALRLDAAPGETERRLAIVQVPPGLTRLVQLARARAFSFVLLEEIISAHLPQPLPRPADPRVRGHPSGARRRAGVRRRRRPHAARAGRARTAAAAAKRRRPARGQRRRVGRARRAAPRSARHRRRRRLRRPGTAGLARR